MAIPFNEAAVMPYKGTLPAIPVKGIGPGSLVATANIDFTQYAVVPVGAQSYAGVFLDFRNSAGVANIIDSIRSITIDNTCGELISPFKTVGAVYVLAPDTGDTVVCPAGVKGSFRIRTNDVRLYAFQTDPNALGATLSTVTLIACNFDSPSDSLEPESQSAAILGMANGGASFPYALGDIAGFALIDLSVAGSTILTPALPVNQHQVMTELHIDSYGLISPTGALLTVTLQIVLFSGTHQQKLLIPSDYSRYANNIVCRRSGLQWSSQAGAIGLNNTPAARGFLNVNFTYTNMNV